ncbi:acetylglutamate kinase [soil metagenome]
MPANSESALTAQIAKAAVLVEALPYLQNFRGQTFLVKVGGSAMEDRALLEGLLRDIVFLEAVGINPVLVHGGGKPISRAMEAAGLAPAFVDGLRITDASAIAVVEKVLGNEISPDLVETLNGFGGSALGISGQSVFVGERIEGKDGQGKPVDLGFVGHVTAVETGSVAAQIAREVVPVVTPLARDAASGMTLNVNADLAASALATALKASKLIYLSDVRGVLRVQSDEGSLISSVSAADFERLRTDGVVSGGMLPKIQSALDAIGAGVGKVHMIDGRIPHSLLLEVFTRTGIGTQIVA